MEMSWLKYDSCAYRIPVDASKIEHAKMACFDMDSTLILSDKGEKYASSAYGYIFAYADVPQKIKEYASKGFLIIIFSNRKGSPWGIAAAQKRVDQMETIFGVPLYAFFATKKDHYRKPADGMMRLCSSVLGIKSYDSESFYCGDASGSTSTVPWFVWSDVDRGFAKAVGLPYKEPQEIFTQFPPPTINPQTRLIISVGQYGSGWEGYCGYIGKVSPLDKERCLIVIDDASLSKPLPFPLEGMTPVYMVLGMHPSEGDRHHLMETFNVTEEQTQIYWYGRSSFDEKYISRDFIKKFQMPSRSTRCN